MCNPSPYLVTGGRLYPHPPYLVTGLLLSTVCLISVLRGGGGKEQDIFRAHLFQWTFTVTYTFDFININNCVTLLKVFRKTLVLSILVNDHTKYNIMVAERSRESGSVIKGMEITILLHLSNYTKL